MSVVDLSNPIKKHWAWAGDSYRPIPVDDRLTETIVAWPKHGFTHVDSPCHMVRGSLTTDECKLQKLCGVAALVDISDLVPAGAANRAVLEQRGGHVRAGDILVLRSNLHHKFPNTNPDYWTNSPYIDASGAQWIVERGCIGLVIDFPQDFLAREMGDRLIRTEEWVEHQIVLGGKLMHLEHVRHLDKVDRDRFFLVGWPVRIPRSDGGPARPVALLKWTSDTPRIADLSLPLSAGWRNYVQVGRAKGFERDDPVQETGFVALGHSHTHVVMPSYVDASLDSLDALQGTGMARIVRAADIVDLTDVAPGATIGADLLGRRARSASPERMLILKTGHADRVDYNSEDWLARSPSLSRDAASWIIDAGYKAVGADFELDGGRKTVGRGLARAGDIPVESALLRAGIVLVKNLAGLSQLKDGHCFVAAMPLNLPGAEAAPARVLALEW